MSSFITTITPSAGIEGERQSVTINVQEHTGRCARRNYVQFKTDKGASDIASIIQLGADENISATVLSGSVDYTGGTIEYIGHSNTKMFRMPKDLSISLSDFTLSISGKSYSFAELPNTNDYRATITDDPGKYAEYEWKLTRTISANEKHLPQQGYVDLYSYLGTSAMTLTYFISGNTINPETCDIILDLDDNLIVSNTDTKAYIGEAYHNTVSSSTRDYSISGITVMGDTTDITSTALSGTNIYISDVEYSSITISAIEHSEVINTVNVTLKTELAAGSDDFSGKIELLDSDGNVIAENNNVNIEA